MVRSYINRTSKDSVSIEFYRWVDEYFKSNNLENLQEIDNDQINRVCHYHYYDGALTGLCKVKNEYFYFDNFNDEEARFKETTPQQTQEVLDFYGVTTLEELNDLETIMWVHQLIPLNDTFPAKYILSYSFPKAYYLRKLSKLDLFFSFLSIFLFWLFVGNHTITTIKRKDHKIRGKWSRWFYFKFKVNKWVPKTYERKPITYWYHKS